MLGESTHSDGAKRIGCQQVSKSSAVVLKQADGIIHEIEIKEGLGQLLERLDAGDPEFGPTAICDCIQGPGNPFSKELVGTTGQWWCPQATGHCGGGAMRSFMWHKDQEGVSDCLTAILQLAET